MTGPLVILILVLLALYFMAHPFLKSIAFTVWVFAFVAVAMFYPAAFGTWFGWDLKLLIVPLIQIIMFGMGTTLNVGDFIRVLTMPWPVFIGMILQFTVMPLAGFLIATLFGSEPSLSAILPLVGPEALHILSNWREVRTLS